MLSLLTRTKSFRDPWVGHPDLNRRWQLHRRRVQLAETLCLWRRLLRPAQLASLERDGFVVLENFLPQPEFEALRDEVEAVVARASRLHPAPDNSRPGFRPKQPFPGGFDRFDGGTLNRFLHIDPEQMPRAAAFSHDQRLSAGSRQVIGLPMNPRKLDIYLTVHGEETRTPDLQKVLHRGHVLPCSEVLVLSPAGATSGRSLRIRAGQPSSRSVSPAVGAGHSHCSCPTPAAARCVWIVPDPGRVPG
ncbi:MAG: hypothetical protein CM15mP39_11560 [Synechococcus sp.]|nr:MAG: hypothetical protein CM15mP39_11560 [Synechococcus sp.]